MNLRQLATFVAIVDGGTLTAAAQRQFKTQGAISHDLRLLEQELGVPLVDRSGQRVRLTTGGEILLPLAREMLARIGDIDRVMRRVRQGESGIVRIGALPTLAEQVADHVAAYSLESTDVRFAIYSELQAALTAHVLNGSLDIAVGTPDLEDELKSTDLGTEDIFVVVQANDPLARLDEVGADDVNGHQFIGFIRDLGASRAGEEFFAAAGQYPTPVVEVEDYNLMIRLISHGVGFGIMPASSIPTALGSELAALPTNPRITRHVSLIQPANRPAPASVASFVDYLRTNWLKGGG